MTTDTHPGPYSRLDPEMTARTRRRLEEARPTKSQSAIEYGLFAVFGITIVIAAIALVITNSANFRHVPNRVAQGIAADRVNILVIQTYTPPNANESDTDALMLLSVKPSTHEVALTSIPRDLWVRLGKYGQRRLGAAPAVAAAAGYPGDGPGLTADTIENVFGQPLHAYVQIDRHDLLKAISSVGGIDIDVAQPIYEYGRRDRFARGHLHLSGQRALRYALSPFVVGPGADRFAREARQEQVLAALIAKATSGDHAAQMASLPIGDHTNLERSQISWLVSTVTGRKPRCVTLAPYMDTFEVTTLADDGEAVRPRNGDYRPLRSLVANVFPSKAVTSN